MAQIIETSNYITIKFPLVRGTEETVRSINLPAPKELVTDIQTGFDNLINEYIGAAAPILDYLFQPTNWRDTDVAEEAWRLKSVNEITYELVNTTRTSGGYQS